MDFKKFSVFVIILGILIAAYGGYNLISLYEKFNKEKGSIGEGGFAKQITAPYDKWMLERSFSEKKKEPIIILIAGGILIFIGVALRYSAKKQ